MARNLVINVKILSDGNRTVAEAINYNYLGLDPASGKGSSGREPGDKQDTQIGEDLAVARALRSMAAHLEKRARGRMRHAESNRQHADEIAAKKKG